MYILLDKTRAARALAELQSPKYDKYFKDDTWKLTRSHMTAAIQLFIEEGVDALDRTYRRQKAYAPGLGSSSLMLGLFLWSLNSDPMMQKSSGRVYEELYKQWGEFPKSSGLMFGFSVIGMLRALRKKVREEDIIAEAEKMLRLFCAEGDADRGLTCFWILLRGYVKELVDA